MGSNELDKHEQCYR